MNQSSSPTIYLVESDLGINQRDSITPARVLWPGTEPVTGQAVQGCIGSYLEHNFIMPT